MPHWSEYTRPISLPEKSRKPTGRFGGPNFSPNCGENGSNSDAKSLVIVPVKWPAMWAGVKT